MTESQHCRRERVKDSRRPEFATSRQGAAGLSVLAALVVVLLGCAGSPPKPGRIEGQIVATAALNPSVSQRPSPLLLRVYELRSPTAFNQADFMSLYQSDQATLGADLVARDEMMLQPGQTLALAKPLGADTRFIGVVGAYRNLERATWRAIVAVQAGMINKLTIHADSLAVSAQLQP